jgi:hypothetical protein
MALKVPEVHKQCTELAREGSVHQFVGHEPARGVLRQNIKYKIKC